MKGLVKLVELKKNYRNNEFVFYKHLWNISYIYTYKTPNKNKSVLGL